MTLNEAQSILSKMTYKPKSQFVARENKHSGMIEFIVESNVLEVMSYPIYILLTNQKSLHPSDLETLTEEKLSRLMLDAVLELEVHEAKEWFKFNGKCVDNPHGVI